MFAAAAIFKRTTENLLQSIDGVVVYPSDREVSGSAFTAVRGSLPEVVRDRAATQKSKMPIHGSISAVFGSNHRCRRNSSEKGQVRAIQEVAFKSSSTSLCERTQGFLGLLNYCREFLHNISSVLAPLYKLLKKRVSGTKNSDDPKNFLACDASSVDIGAVLSH